MSLNIGDKVPELSLPASSSKEVSLTDYKGKNIVLYFYPKDQTPGCTQEACDFRDNIQKFQDKDTVIIGVSKDSLKSHEAFVSKYMLPFELVSDSEHKLMKLFGVTGRTTFLIDKTGKIVKEWRGVKVPKHVEAVFQEAANL